MGRNRKIGLDYFPMDVDFFQDIRIRKLIKYQGGKAVTVYALLLCIIYKQGYYMRWDEELPFIVSEQTGFEEAYIQEVFKCCMVVGLFSKELYDSDKVITSKGIQERYKIICDQLRRVCQFDEFGLISSEEISISSEENGISSEEKGISSAEMPINSAKSTQKKGKEKGNINENKGNKIIQKENSPNGESKKGELSLSQPEKIDFVGMMNYFNSTFNGKLQTIKSIDEKRKKAIKARVAQYGKEAVMQVFQNVLHSEFLLENNDRNWRVDFDWIFKPASFTKILEGNYNGKRVDTVTTKKESVTRLKDLAGAILQNASTKESK